MGVTSVPCIVADLPAGKAKEYRVLDNKISEYTSWNDEALMLELREFESDLIDAYFPDVDLEIGMIDSATKTTADDVEAASKRISDMGTGGVAAQTMVTCPSCFHEFEVQSSTL